MVPTLPLELPSHTWSALLSYLQESGSNAEPEEAIAVAVEEWITNERARAEAKRRGRGVAHSGSLGRTGATGSATGSGSVADPGRGYQWKSLFLPAGTRLRMWYGDKFHYAEVVGDDIIHDGRAVSPARMANEVAGNTRNAWRDIWLLLPGETRWKVASLRRRQAQQLEERLALGPPAPAPAPAAPVPAAHEQDESSKHLRRLASLIEQALAMRQVAPFRRHTDVLGDSVAFD